MKIFDCFTFNDENHILDIRLNELNEYVDFFIIVEFGQNHQGLNKGKKINEKLLDKFKKKIKYFYFDKFEPNLSAWERENFQRNQINKGLDDAKNEDIVIISDVDEIPNLKEIDFSKIDKHVYAFSQVHSMYKLNLIRNEKWVGTKLCKKEILKSPQWLRSLKVHKKYSFLRFDKYFSKTYYNKFKLIKNGGWHIAWLRKPEEVINKVNAYAHTEHNIPKFNDKNYIQECIKKNISFIDNDDKLSLKKELNFLPKYIINNIDQFKEWIKKE